MADDEIMWVRIFRGAIKLIQVVMLGALILASGVAILPLVALWLGFI